MKIPTRLIISIFLVTVILTGATVSAAEPFSCKIYNSRQKSPLLDLYRASQPPQTEWNRTYGGAKADAADSIVETSDGGYMLAGYTTSHGAGSYDAWLVKADSAGMMQWNRTYGGTDADWACFALETSDAGYVLAGSTLSFGAGNYDFWLVRVDSSGSVLWNKTYGGVDNDIAHSLIQTSDGGYALAGDTESYGAGGYDFWLLKTDSSGNSEWNKTYGDVDNDIAHSLIQTSDGGYALAGHTKSFGAGLSDFWLVKTNAAGNMQWNKTYGGTGNDIAWSIIQTSDEGYALAGDTESYGAGGYDFWLLKTDSSGNPEWNRTYGGTENDIAYSVIQTGDGGYALAGDTESYGAGDYDFWLIRTDSLGSVQWDRTYGGPNRDRAYSVVVTSDGGYALAGDTASYDAGESDFWLVKVAAETGTEVHDVAVTDVTPSKSVVGQGYSLFINITVQNQGDYTEIFNVTAYADLDTAVIGDEITVETRTITLANGASTVVTFTWNTTGVAYGDYTLSAVADTVPDETDTADNTREDGSAFVTIPGDVNGDGKVDAYDLLDLSKAYSSTLSKPNWNPNSDLNGDDRVDASDLSELSKNYGKSWL